MNKLFIFLALFAIGSLRLQAQNINLANLNSTGGLVVTSIEDALVNANVNYAGDINNDGVDDLLLWTDFNLYLIYGTNGTNGTNGSSQVDLSNFTSAQGFIIYEAFEFSYSGVGDVNGDKIDDLVAGNNDTVCVIFGSQTPIQNLNISDCGSGFGISISGCIANYTGCGLGGVYAAGDINGDNIQDILLGSDLSGPVGREGSGVVYVIWGNEGGLSNINLTNLTNTQGFSIIGPAKESYIGRQMSQLGDVNGDGIDDVIINSYYGFPGYVLYGNTNGFSDIDLVNFTSTQGFTISVPNNSSELRAVSYAGDVNGDLINDILLGTDDSGTNEMAFVLFGSNSTPFNVAISNITSAQGFSIETSQTTSNFGQSVSGLGDFNQDGLDDVIVSAYGANNGTGAAYVIFGTKSQPGSISVDTFPSTEGIAILGAQPNEQIAYIVSGIGDFNGDNVPDIALSTHSDIASGYVVYSPYGSNPHPNPPGPLSGERIGYSAFIMGVVAFILCMF